MLRKAAALLAVLVPSGAATAWFLGFFDLEGPRHLAAAAGATAVTALLTAWNFELASGRTPSWDSIGLWVGRGLARVSYVALFGIPVLASVYGAAETAPPPIFLLGYLSSLAFAAATTSWILRGRFPRLVEPAARWAGALSISIGFHVLVLLFYAQALEVGIAYAKPRRELSLEPARHYVEGLDREASDLAGRIVLLHERIAETSASIRTASERLTQAAEAMGETGSEVRRAAASVDVLARELHDLLEEMSAERKRWEKRLPFLK